MITYKTANNHPALIVGNRLQKTLNYLHNSNTPFGFANVTIKKLTDAWTECRTLWALLYSDFDGITETEADRLREEIHSAYANAVTRIRAKRGQTTTA